MRNFSIRLTTEQNNLLEALSVKSGDSKADHIRFAVERYLGDPKLQQKDPAINRRLVELIEFNAMAVDHYLKHKYDDETRDRILIQVSENLDQYHG